jgi:ABC-type sugar transport system substrate-binding protein
LGSNLKPPFHIASDFREGGKLAATTMLGKLKNGSNIGIIAGPQNSNVSRIRKSAFVEEILSHSLNLNIVCCQYTNWKKKEGKDRTQDILKMFQKIDGLFCCNDNLALGALEAIEEYHQNDIVIMGYDGIEQIREKIRDGKIYGTIDVKIDDQAGRLARELLKIFENKDEYINSYHLQDLMIPVVLTHENVED